MMFFFFLWSSSINVVPSMPISVVGEALRFSRALQENEAMICLCESLSFGPKSQKL